MTLILLEKDFIVNRMKKPLGVRGFNTNTVGNQDLTIPTFQ